MISDFPEAFYISLFFFVFAILFWQLFSHRKKIVNLVAPKTNQYKLIKQPSTKLKILKISLICLIWITACLALMQLKGSPQKKEEIIPQQAIQNVLMKNKQEMIDFKQNMHNVLFLLDASASMSVTDMPNNTSRLETAKQIILNTANQLQGESIALFAFTSDMTTIVPPTMNYLFFQMRLSQIGINEGDVAGTNIFKALEKIKRYYENPNVFSTLVILSDGENTSLEMKKQTTPIVHSKNLHLIVVGMGSKNGGVVPEVKFENKPVVSTLNENLLKQLIKTKNDHYYAPADKNISTKIATLITKRQNLHEIKQQQHIASLERIAKSNNHIYYKLYFQIPLFCAILLLMLELLIFRIKSC